MLGVGRGGWSVSGYKPLSFGSILQVTVPFSLSLQGASCYQGLSLLGILQCKVASQFSPIQLMIKFHQYLFICFAASQILLLFFSFILFTLVILCLKIMTITNPFCAFIRGFGTEWIKMFMFNLPFANNKM